MVKQPEGANEAGPRGSLELPVPVPAPKLFRYNATNDVLAILFDNPTETFSIRQLSRLTDHSPPSITRAVDTLEANRVVVVEAPGNRRQVSIDPTRITKPDDPVLSIPQPEFHTPVRTAVQRFQDVFDDLEGLLVFGSVARGTADRQSDIDLWILVAENQGARQHRANEIAKELGRERFDGDRYEFQVLVESVDSAHDHGDQLVEIFTDAITLVESDSLRDLKREVLGNAG